MILPGSAPSMSKRTIRVISNQVLPLPADAETVALRVGSQASRVFGLLFVGCMGAVYRVLLVSAMVGG